MGSAGNAKHHGATRVLGPKNPILQQSLHRHARRPGHNAEQDGNITALDFASQKDGTEQIPRPVAQAVEGTITNRAITQGVDGEHPRNEVYLNWPVPDKRYTGKPEIPQGNMKVSSLPTIVVICRDAQQEVCP